jgi:hypothetical protein
MANENPYQGRRALAQRKALSRQGMEDVLENLIRINAEIMKIVALDAPDLTLRAGHCLAAVSTSILKYFESLELEERLTAMEARFTSAPN